MIITLKSVRKVLHKLQPCRKLFITFITFLVLTSSMSMLAQTTTDNKSENSKSSKVRGKVTDKNTGETLIGASVVVKGTTTGTTSDMDGNFTLEIPNDQATLIINYVGYKKIEIPIVKGSDMKILLESNSVTMNEVVVVGYGTSKKLDLTSSISSISAKDLKSMPAVSSESFLQGRATGVQVASNTGAPGSSVSVKIRGVVTTGSSQPLYVVDGMPMASSGGDNSFGINSLNPSDIESIQILKDASSAAIYGSRGSNGVILITTKRGKSGKPTVTLSTYYGTQTQAHKISVLNKDQYKQYYDMLGIYKHANKANTYDNIKPYDAFNDPTLFAALPNVDWQNEIFTSAPTSNVQLSMAGGTDNSAFMISVGNTSQNGMVAGSDYNRTNLRINSDHTINKWLKFGESVSLSNSVRHRVMEGGGFNFVSASPVTAALVSDPTTKPYATDGSLNYMQRSGSFNGIGIRDRANYTYNNKKLNGSMYFEISLLKELKFKTNLGVDYNLGETKEFSPSFNVLGSPLNEGQLVPIIKRMDAHTTYLVLENTLSYNKSFGKHVLGVMVGQTVESNSNYDLGGSSTSISGNQDYLQYLSAGNPSDPNRSIYGGASEWRMFSYLTRINYSYNDRYLLTGSVRNDNSSKFGPNKRSAIFPAASIGWKIKNEEFLKDIDWLYMAKIRLGWGQVGNQNNIGYYSYNTAIQPDANYAFGNPKISTAGVTAGVMSSGYGGQAGGKPGNKDLTWETTQTKNLGVDVSLFENRLSFTADWFLKDNTGMLMQATVPDYLGIDGPDINGGKIQNEGYEFEVTHRKIEGDFTYDVGFNVTYIKTKVIELAKPKLSNDVTGSGDYLSRTLQGGGIADFWGLKADGVFQNAAEVAKGPFQQNGTKAGDIRFVDMNRDGKIDLNDYTIIGSPIPDFNYGFTLNLYYKNFDLNVFLQGVQGNQIYNNLYRTMMGPWGINHSTDILNSWTSTNTNTNIPRIQESSSNKNDRPLSDRWIEDGSYLRLKTLSLGYTLPKKWASKVAIQSLRVYTTVSNL